MARLVSCCDTLPRAVTFLCTCLHVCALDLSEVSCIRRKAEGRNKEKKEKEKGKKREKEKEEKRKKNRLGQDERGKRVRGDTEEFE